MPHGPGNLIFDAAHKRRRRKSTEVIEKDPQADFDLSLIQ